jgi:hypothetical protein
MVFLFVTVFLGPFGKFYRIFTLSAICFIATYLFKSFYNKFYKTEDIIQLLIIKALFMLSTLIMGVFFKDVLNKFFLQQDLAEKQSETIKAIFNNLPDAVLVLSKVEEGVRHPGSVIRQHTETLQGAEIKIELT